MQYSVLVKTTYPFNRALVCAREFLKAQPTLINEVELTDEIRNSPILSVTPYESPTVETNDKMSEDGKTKRGKSKNAPAEADPAAGDKTAPTAGDKDASP